MRIAFQDFGPHWISSIEPVLDRLLERGHTLISFEEETSEEVDAFILTSNAIKEKIIGNKIFFVPHGIGKERWEERMRNCTRVFLSGQKPLVPPEGLHNWEIVGWPKTDALFNPGKEQSEYAENLVKDLPFKDTCLLIPWPDDSWCIYSKPIVEFALKQEINLIIPFREKTQRAKNLFKDYKNLVYPEILNLYYFTPYIKTIIVSGLSSIGREFYIKNIPTFHIIKGFDETRKILRWEEVDDKSLKRTYEEMENNPINFIQRKEITREFIEILDGKVTERIVKRIEELE